MPQRAPTLDEAFEVLGTPPEQRVPILASTVFCAETPHGLVVKQAISAAIRKHKETIPLPEIPPPLVPPNAPTPDQLALLNYQNQLQRESNKVAMRQYNNKMYNAMIVMDTFTKYAILIPMRRQDETTTADALFYEVFMTRGFPSEIL